MFREAKAFNGDVSNWVLDSCLDHTCVTSMFILCEAFQGTLCGGEWYKAVLSTGQHPGGDDSLRSYAQIGCCPAGSFMSNPEVSPFSKASSCSACPVGQFTEDVPNIKTEWRGLNGGVDDTSCKSCPKGYEADGTITTGCQICSFSKVRLLLSP